MTTYYKATFMDGQVETRSTVARRYAECVRYRYTYEAKSWRPAGSGEEVTWCGTVALASRAVSRGAGYGRTTQTAERAPAIEITAAEYRRLRLKLGAPA